MKHIKRKYLLRVANSALQGLDQAGQLKSESHKDPSEDFRAFISDGKEKIAILATDRNELVVGFVHRVGDKLFAIPEPDPVLVYFNNAQKSYRLIEKFKDNLFSNLQPLGNTGVFAGDVGDKLYDFMYASTSCAIFLFTAIEVMMNKMIPVDFIYEKHLESGKTKRLNFEQIQRRLDFKEKLQILKLVTGKSFLDSNSEDYDQILLLQELRNSIIHTKKQLGGMNTFSHVFTESLSFSYSNAIVSVKNLINFYQQGWVEECDCGRDF